MIECRDGLGRLSVQARNCQRRIGTLRASRNRNAFVDGRWAPCRAFNQQHSDGHHRSVLDAAFQALAAVLFNPLAAHPNVLARVWWGGALVELANRASRR